MNNYKEIRLTHYQSTSEATAKFIDGSGNSRRYLNVTPTSIERLQNTIIKAVSLNKCKVRLPFGFCDVGWVAGGE